MKVKYIDFSRARPSKTGKTSIWRCMAINGLGLRYCLGEIRWAAPWRRYAYFPLPFTVYEKDCLRTIADFVDERTTRHRKRLAKKRRELR